MHSTMKNLAATLTVFALISMQAVASFGQEQNNPKVKAGVVQGKVETAKGKPEVAPVKTEITAKGSPDDVLVKVNGTAITRAELDRATQVLLAQSRAPQDISPELRKQAESSALDQLISAELLYQKGLKLEIKDLDKQMADKLSLGKARFGNPAEYEAALKANNLNEKGLQEIIRKDIVINNLLEKEIVGKIKVSDADVKKFYDENLEKFKKPETYQASHILIGVDPQSKPEDKQKAKEKAEAVRKKIVAGEDFAALAKAESSCPSKEKGGDLGTFGKGEMVPEFDKAIAALKPGQISDVVETQFGYHIIKLVDKKDAGVVGFDEVKDKINQYLKQNKSQQVMLDYIADLKSKATIEIPAVK